MNWLYFTTALQNSSKFNHDWLSLARTSQPQGWPTWPDYFVSLLLVVMFICIVDTITNVPIYPPPPSP